MPTPTFSEGVQGFIETGFQAPGTPGFMRSAQKFANREAMLQRNLDRARPGLYSNLNLVENLLSRVGKLGYITDADVGYIQDLQGEFTRMKSLPINFGAPLVSRGEVGTVGGTIDKAQSLLSTLLGMRFNAAALQQLLKSTAQEDAEAQGKIKVKQYEEEQP